MHENPYGQRMRFKVRSLLAAMVILGGLFAAYGWYYRTILVPRHHHDEIQRLIYSLAQRRPATMTRGQWGSAVAWTRNLHGNSMLVFEADGSTLTAFEQRLRTRLEGNVDMGTIHWIWGEYADICPHGASYQKFKPMMLEEIGSVGPNDDVWGMKVP